MKHHSTTDRASKRMNRNSVIRVRVTAVEKAKAAALAKDSGMNASDLIRELLFHGPVAKVEKTDPEKTRQIARIGNNLNQIARACNEQHKIGNKIPIYKVLLALQKIETEIACL